MNTTELPHSRATYTYDLFGRVTDILHENGSGIDLAEFKYGYYADHAAKYMDKAYFDDRSGVSSNQVTSTPDMDLGEQYTYDTAGRLGGCLRGVSTAYITDPYGANFTVPANYSYANVYDYDKVGNRLGLRKGTNSSQVTTSYAYDVVNEMTTEGGVSQNYTPPGNFSGTSNAYKYDFANRLGEATSGNTFTYHYDALGRLVQRDHPTLAIRFYYDGLQCVEQNRWANTGGFSETSRKLFVFGPQIDELLLYVDEVGGAKEYYAHADRLGSVQLLYGYDSNLSIWRVLESYRYNEFGNTTIVDDNFQKLTTTVQSPLGNPHMYTGQRQDVQIGSYGDFWYMYRARIMRPAVGRFLERDSVGYRDGASLYTYVAGDPINLKDPLGLYGDPGDALIKGLGRAALAVAPFFGKHGLNADEQAVYDDPDTGGAEVMAVGLSHEAGLGAARTFADVMDKTLGGGAGQYDLTHQGGYTDAMQHCTASCEMSKLEEMGAIKPGGAEEWGNAHEGGWGRMVSTPGVCALPLGPAGFASLKNAAMDLHNNRIGREIGKNGGDCFEGCEDKLQDGTLAVLPGMRIEGYPPPDPDYSAPPGVSQDAWDTIRRGGW